MKLLTQQLKRLKDDERGVSPVVGFILIFALIMIVYSMYQASVVPQQNEQVEYEHSQTIEGQMEQLSAAYLSAEKDGPTRSVALQLGVEYPTRTLAINPGNPVGTLSTSDQKTVELTYDGKTQPFDTKFVNYQPIYNLMQEETLYSIEYGMLVKDYSGSDNTGLAYEGSILSSDGNTVNLNLITGDLHANEMSTVVSADNIATHTIEVTSSGATLTLPTKMEESDWESILRDDNDDLMPQLNGYDYKGDRITLDIKQGKSIKLQKDSTGDPTSDDNDLDMQPFIEKVTEEPLELEPITEDMQTELEVRTIDVFGSAYADQDIEFTQTGGSGSLEPNEMTSDDDGLAAVIYDPVASDAGQTIEVTASVPEGSGSGSSVTYELEYPEPESATGDGKIDPGAVNGAPLDADAFARSYTHPSFKINVQDPSQPIEVKAMAVETKNDLSGVEETWRRDGSQKTHNYKIYQSGLSKESETPLQLDGTIYDFGSEGAITSSRVQIERFQSDHGIRLMGTADSYADADVTFWFILTDGTVRPVYLDAKTK